MRTTRRNRPVRLPLLILLITLPVACAGPRVATDWDPTINWPALTHYAWLPEPPGHAGDPRLHNDLIDGRVRRAAEERLSERGFEKVPIDRANFFVAYYLGLDTRVSVQWVTHTHAYRRGGWHERHVTQMQGREHEVGTLMIDVLGRRRNLVWRGTTSSRLRRTTDPSQREELITTSVAAILDRFPPTEDCPGCR